jgi:single-strand DNA-binding protein
MREKTRRRISMQKIVFTGRLVRDVDLKTTPNGVQVASFTVAVDRKQKSKDGEKATDFYNCVVWRQLADVCHKYLSKGKKCYIEGELQPRMYQSKSGETKMSLDVQVSEIEFLSPKSEERSDADESGIDASGFENVSSDSIPF